MLKFICNIFKNNLGGKKTDTTSPVSVSFDAAGVYVEYGSVEKGRVKWSDIDLVEISIEDEFLPFPYWYIGNKENLLRIPGDAIGASELFFDGLEKYIDGYGTDEAYNAIIESSAAMEGSFIVWKSPNVIST